MSEGKIFLVCGCEYKGSMDDLDKTWREFEETICTRDADNPFVTATIYGHYCDKCWSKMQEGGDE